MSGSKKQEAGGKVLRITLIKSPIGYSYRQKRTVQALGLRRMQQTVEQDDTPVIRGMIAKVSHLVTVESE
ncbi:MAG: 50S ribosomal protein L30 [Chloroflexi bacterium]|nr:MAG: 50S ribosomal protein L30 [Anaerolineaceae bacterium 4572_32.2]RLC81501.1 MAG: 50S ribosomal protein L30 [Chloroflexota bacterium]RLC88581.1 MAG: 50S ribosomal protein L30 [Chloroflexota bacterium]HEY74049.1 50S ribosomal protein L30 [Thermoflexia bacterium]